MSISKFEEARRIDLPAFAESVGIPLRRQGSSLGSYVCPSCGKAEHVTSNRLSVFMANEGIWRWKCFSCPASGTAIDFGAALWGIPAKDAVDRLVGDGGNNYPIPAKTAVATQRQPPKQSDPAAVKQVLTAIASHARPTPQVTQYLEGRGIPRALQVEAWNRGILRTLPGDPYACARFLDEICGAGLLSRAGFLKDGNRWPAIAFRPLVFMLPNLTGAEFRLAGSPKGDEPKSIRYGRLQWPWFWKGEGVNRATIVEGAIDLLSVVMLGEKGNIMGLPGVQSWKPDWLGQLATKHPNIEICVGLDADSPGEVASFGILEAAASINLPNRRVLPPGACNDWNESLTKRHVMPRLASA